MFQYKLTWPLLSDHVLCLLNVSSEWTIGIWQHASNKFNLALRVLNYAAQVPDCRACNDLVKDTTLSISCLHIAFPSHDLFDLFSHCWTIVCWLMNNLGVLNHELNFFLVLELRNCLKPRNETRNKPGHIISAISLCGKLSVGNHFGKKKMKLFNDAFRSILILIMSAIFFYSQWEKVIFFSFSHCDPDLPKWVPCIFTWENIYMNSLTFSTISEKFSWTETGFFCMYLEIYSVRHLQISNHRPDTQQTCASLLWWDHNWVFWLWHKILSLAKPNTNNTIPTGACWL